MRPVGLFGGTFDPIHLGHIRAACAVSHELGLAALHLVPNADPPHRAPAVSAPRHRMAMVRLAAAAIPGAYADDRELLRSGSSYTVDTLSSLRAEYGETPLCLMLGADTFAGLPHWHRWESLLQLAHIVVLRRPGYALPDPYADDAWWADYAHDDTAALRGRPSGVLYFSHSECPMISAGAIRDALAGRGHIEAAARDLLPTVAAYIGEHRLYGVR